MYSGLKVVVALLSAILVLVFLNGCSKVPTGNVGMKVYLLGSDKGVDSEPLGTGRYWIGINEELYLFPIFTQNYVWTADSRPGSETNEGFTFQTVEGLSVGADIGISYSLEESKVPVIFQKYRRGIDEITDTYLRNMVQDALIMEASTLPMETVYGKGKSDLMSGVERRVRDQVQPIGIIIERIYWIGDLRLPVVVVDALNAKIAATQKAQQRENEIAQAKAEADKAIKIATGEAEALKLKRAQLSPELIKLKELEVQEKAIEKWNGALPGVTGGVMPFLNVTPN